MKFHIRIDSASPERIILVLIIDSVNCGRLTMKVREYERFSRLLLMGGMKWGVGSTIQCDGYALAPKVLKKAIK